MSDACFLYSAVLDKIQEVNPGSYICYSTLTITPGNLDDNLTLVQSGVCKQWTELLEWITGLTFDLKISNIVVRREKLRVRVYM